MNTIILFWNPDISSYTIERLREDLSNYAHVSNWSVWEHDKAHKGDRFFMVRCGKGKTGICMSGRFRSEPYMDEDWSGKGREVYYMDLMADTVIDPDLLPILSTEELSREIPSFDWSGGHSGRVLPVEDAEKLEKLWVDFLEENKPMFGMLTLKSDISDEDIMGKGITIHLEKPNTLSKLLSKKDRNEVISLKITGLIGKKDFEDVLDDMCTVWSDFEDEDDEEGTPDYENAAPIRNLDLGEATYVDGKELPYFGYHTQLETLILPKGISSTLIKGEYESGITDSKKLTTLILPKGLKRVRNFSNCPHLTNLVLPKSVRKIDDFAFAGCTDITKIHIPASVKEMNGTCFADCNLQAYELADDNPYFTVMDGVIYSKDLTTLVAFPSAYPYKHFSVPKGTKVIGYGAFMDSRIETIHLPDGLEVIETWAFQGSKIKSFEMPDSVTKIDELLFRFCTELEHLKLSKSLTELPAQLISSCSKLKVLDIPSSVKKVDATNLVWCNSLEQIVFRDGLEEIVNGTAMIVERGHLKEVNYPKTLRKIPGGLFHNCPEIKEFNIDPENPYFCAIEGAIYTKDGKKLIAVPDAWREEFVVHNGTEEIDGFVFSDFFNLKKIILPESLKIIGHRAFNGCETLKELRIPCNVESIDYRALDECKSLRKLVIEAVKPPKMVDFSRNWDFADGNKKMVVYVPHDSLKAYKAAKGWKNLRIRKLTLNTK